MYLKTYTTRCTSNEAASAYCAALAVDDRVVAFALDRTGPTPVVTVTRRYWR